MASSALSCCVRREDYLNEFGDPESPASAKAKASGLARSTSLDQGKRTGGSPRNLSARGQIPNDSMTKRQAQIPQSPQTMPMQSPLKEDRSGSRDKDELEPRKPMARTCNSLVTVAVAICVFFFESAAYNFIFLGRILPAVGKEALIMPFLFLFNALWVMALWSYIRAHVSDPGSVPDRWRDFVRGCGDALPIAPARAEWQPGKATYCKKCGIPRPERAHHCHLCGMCVLRMDHHCPYINNCVGFGNHKFFLLLVMYSCSVSVTALATSLPELMYVYFALQAQELQSSDAFVFLIFGLLALLLSALLLPMVPIHLSLASRNSTSIETNYTNMPNPFDLGRPIPNILQIMGNYGIDWFFPVMPWRPTTDGVTFLRCDDTVDPNGKVELPQSGLGEDEPELERLWRLRYHVRAPQLTRNFSDHSSRSQRPLPGPFGTLTRWLSSTSANSITSPSPSRSPHSP
mmetsp:Transcript_108696/g.242691  ORF Transcript_108696/g.242691 Transcript_108696/m.242691 type:complete len:460 (+) Transcript_108696:1-1380(+)